MSSAIHVHLEPQWENLVKQFATRHISRVHLSRWDPENPELELSCKYFSCWVRFSDDCQSLKKNAPPSLWEKFYAVFRPVLDRAQEVDFEPAKNSPCEEPVAECSLQEYFWEQNFMILSPETCLKLSEASQEIRVADYWPYFQTDFEGSSNFRTFEEFEDYARSWIKCFRKAAWENAGMVVACHE